ncbi:Syntaxin-1B [Drechslerella dactyloides]|uniref:Syntaxin-1B n=1 Tax=Drechslerella dactyloides TaxID=74499 RepID=A0AAD6J8N2_DREDA|nr:Syntaxin-1B [Drechslerella dactyloides]
MAFDGPYPSHSRPMERVILNALSYPVHEDIIVLESVDKSSFSNSAGKRIVFGLHRHFFRWIRSRTIFRRLRSFRATSETSSISTCSSVSLPSAAAEEFLPQVPEGNRSVGQLERSIQNMDRCFITSTATDSNDSGSLTDVSFMSPCGSLKSSFGCGNAEAAEILAINSTPSIRIYRSAAAGILPKEKRAAKVKEQYLEVSDGVWDAAEENPYATEGGPPSENPYSENPYSENPYSEHQNPYSENQNPYATENPYGGQNPYAASNPYTQNPYAQNPYGSNDAEQDMQQQPDAHDTESKSEILQEKEFGLNGHAGDEVPTDDMIDRPPSTASGTQAFLEEITVLHKANQDITDRIADLDKLHQESLSQIDESASAEFRERIDAAVAEIQQMNTTMTQRIKEIKGGTFENSDRSKHVELVEKNFRQNMQRQREVEVEYRKKERDVLERQYRIVNPDATDEEIEQVREGGSDLQIFLEATKDARTTGAKAAVNEVRSRYNEIQKIEQTMVELSELFEQLNQLVWAQETEVEQIKKDGEDAEANLGEAVQHLDAAIVSSASARKKKWWLFLILVIILAIIGVVIATQVAKKSE